MSDHEPHKEKSEQSRIKKTHVAIIIALIGLVGTICAVLIALPMLSNLFLRTSEPTLTPTPVLAATASLGDSCNNAIFVSDVTIPDETVMTPNQTFIKTWRVKNVGSCAWDNAYSLVFIGGNNILNSQDVSIGNVASGSEVDISVELIAPSAAGRHEGYWRLRGNQGNFFGAILGVIIEVKP